MMKLVTEILTGAGWLLVGETLFVFCVASLVLVINAAAMLRTSLSNRHGRFAQT